MTALAPAAMQEAGACRPSDQAFERFGEVAARILINLAERDAVRAAQEKEREAA